MFCKSRVISAVAIAAGLATAIPAPASARDGVNAILGGVLGVVTLGAIASANSPPPPPVAYQVYQAPPQVVYQAPPVVYYAPTYAPPPVVYYAPGYRAYGRRYWN